MIVQNSFVAVRAAGTSPESNDQMTVLPQTRGVIVR